MHGRTTRYDRIPHRRGLPPHSFASTQRHRSDHEVNTRPVLVLRSDMQEPTAIKVGVSSPTLALNHSTCFVVHQRARGRHCTHRGQAVLPRRYALALHQRTSGMCEAPPQVPGPCVPCSLRMQGMCYIETKNLDGETNLKERLAMKSTSAALDDVHALKVRHMSREQKKSVSRGADV